MNPVGFDESKGLGLDDRIGRSWVEVAESTGSLLQLRVLGTFNRANQTTQAFQVLERLQLLELE